MEIGVLKGRKGRNNRGVLELLYEEGSLKPWGIAKKMSSKMERTQDIYSILVRKSGRLNELQEKKYIRKLSNGEYMLELKGVVTVLAINDDIPKIWEGYARIFSDFLRNPPEPFKMPLLKLAIPDKMIENMTQAFLMDLLPSGDVWIAIKEETEYLLKNSLNLDEIDNVSLIILLVTNFYSRHINELSLKNIQA